MDAGGPRHVLGGDDAVAGSGGRRRPTGRPRFRESPSRPVPNGRRIELLQSDQGDRLGRVEGRLDGVDERLGRMEKTQEQILDLLRGRAG